MFLSQYRPSGSGCQSLKRGRCTHTHTLGIRTCCAIIDEMASIALIGWFSDLPHGDYAAPRVADHTGELAPALGERIAKYLDSGAVISEPGTDTIDPLQEKRPVIGSLRVMTDGEFIWPSDLSYFVRTYGVGLPKQVIEKMHAADWKARPLTDEDLLAVCMALEELNADS